MDAEARRALLLFVDRYGGQVPMGDTAHGLDFIGQSVDPIRRTLERNRKPVTIRVDRRGQYRQYKVAASSKSGVDSFSGLADSMVADHAEEGNHRLAASLQLRGCK